jgi:hypothetical protein
MSEHPDRIQSLAASTTRLFQSEASPLCQIFKITLKQVEKTLYENDFFLLKTTTIQKKLK